MHKTREALDRQQEAVTPKAVKMYYNVKNFLRRRLKINFVHFYIIDSKKRSFFNRHGAGGAYGTKNGKLRIIRTLIIGLYFFMVEIGWSQKWT